MKDDQDNSCEKVILKGTLRAQNLGLASFSGKIIAILNLGIKKYTFSGSRIERLAVNAKGGSSGGGLRNFKDDPSIDRSVRTISFAKNIEYRF